MLEERVDDKAFIRLIRKWLKAGVLEEAGEVIHPATGTPQGGIISPVLSNLYLHYVLDLWMEKVVPKRIRGTKVYMRFADDCAPRVRDGLTPRFARNCVTDEGMRRPLGICLQEPVSNHLRLLWSKATVVSTRRKRLGKNRVR